MNDEADKGIMNMNLEASELRYRRLFETAKDGILLLDADTGRITDVNPFLQDMLGYSHTELIGRALWEIGPVKDIAASQDAMHQLQKMEYVRYENLPLETKAGQHIQVEFVSNVVPGQWLARDPVQHPRHHRPQTGREWYADGQ